MLNIVIFGPPGAGKGTQSFHLIEKYELIHFSTGDIFRLNIKGGTRLGKLAKSYMDKGELVPDKITIKMLEREVNQYDSSAGFIFDGFPRTPSQAEALDRVLASKKASITTMIALEVPEEELKRRLIERSNTEERMDDANLDIIQNRINVYNQETAPIKDFYKKQGKLVSIEGVGSVEEIFKNICHKIEALTT